MKTLNFEPVLAALLSSGSEIVLLVAALLVFVAMVGAGVALVIWLRRQNDRRDVSPPIPPAAPARRVCQGCGKEISTDAPQGLCPTCLMNVALGSEGGNPAGSGERKPAPPPAAIASHFPQLEILELLGQGGMGAVYKARQRNLDRWVALKILPAHSAADAGFAERFNREARALARLSHPNIVAVYDFGVAAGILPAVEPGVPPGGLGVVGPKHEGISNDHPGGQMPLPQCGTGGTPAATGPLHYLIMEYVDGLNLRQLEQAGKLSPHEALQIIPQICEALQFAHDEGIVHRDIKPENVLLDKKGRVKIADFGLARILGHEPESFRLTGAKDFMGTPHYMAPEQIEHPQTVDHRADIYSLGVVFYEMLTGELPLGRFAPPSSRMRGIQVDVRLDEVVLHALEKEPARRYQHASELKTEVETIATSPPGGSRHESARSSPQGRQSRLTSAATHAHRPLAWVALLLAGLSGVLGIATFCLFPNPPAILVWSILVSALAGIALAIPARDSRMGKQAIAVGGVNLAIWLVVAAAVQFINRSPPTPPAQQQAGELEFRLVAAEGDTRTPADELADPNDRTGQQKLRVLKEVLLDSSAVASASLVTTQAEQKEISVVLKDDAAQKFADFTAAHVGRRLAIVWRGRILSAPVIRTQISGPAVSVTGTMSDAESVVLLDLLNFKTGKAAAPSAR